MPEAEGKRVHTRRIFGSGEHRGMTLNPNVSVEPSATPPTAPAMPNPPAPQPAQTKQSVSE